MVYDDIQFSMAEFREWVDLVIHQARTILHEELLLGLDGVPTYDLRQLVNNWDASRPGHCFVDDPRNDWLLQGGQDWLLEEVRKHPDLAQLTFFKDGRGHWRPRSE